MEGLKLTKIHRRFLSKGGGDVPTTFFDGRHGCYRHNATRSQAHNEECKRQNTVTASNSESNFIGCSFFAYSWKLPAYSGAFLLTIDNFSFSAYSWSFFCLQF